MAGLANQLSRQVLALVANTRLNGDWLHAAFRDFYANIVTAIGQTTSGTERAGRKLAILYLCTCLPTHAADLPLHHNAQLCAVR